MDKMLVVKILGKKDSGDFDEQIYNLRDITDELSYIITLGLNIEEDLSNSTDKRLKAIYNILKPIKEKLDSPDAIVGYTNSKVYLSKFIGSLNTNIQEILDNLKPLNIKKVTYHNNIIMDLVLSY